MDPKRNSGFAGSVSETNKVVSYSNSTIEMYSWFQLNSIDEIACYNNNNKKNILIYAFTVHFEKEN